MRLKIVGDGTLNGSVVVDADTNCELRTVQSFEWYLSPGNGNSWVRLKISDVFFEIDPSTTFVAPTILNPPASMTMNLKVIGDGTEAGTYIVNAENHDVLENVSYQTWCYEPDYSCVCLSIEISNVTMKIVPFHSLPVPSSAPVTVSGTAGPFSIPNPAPALNPTNPYYPFGSFGPASGSGQSNPDPLLPGMPPDLLSMQASTCIHEWVNVGFSSLKYVCKKCNAERNS